ncbi:DUF3857 domain-containing protein [Flavitalea flava]
MPSLRLSVVLFLLFLLQSYCYAQEKSKVQFGKVSSEDFSLPANPIIDSNANAVILADIGAVSFVGNKHSRFSYVFKRLTRIKILNKKAFEQGTVRIYLYNKDEYLEKADNIEASTYNLENGKVAESKLDKKEIFDDKQDKYQLIRKFTLPAVKDGSIIEYSYTITSDYCFHLPSWEFQSVEYPCLWSELSVNIPQTLSYVFVKRGVHDFTIDKKGEGKGSYLMLQGLDRNFYGDQGNTILVKANTVKHQWVMKDIPAFHVENFLSSPTNYTDKIEFQLAQTYNGETTRDVMNTWSKATEELLKEEDFGEAISNDNYDVSDLANKIPVKNPGLLEQAKTIFYYVNSHFTCTNYYNPHIKTSLKDVLKKNSGTVGDINLLLIALLRKKYITADPVLLSTREQGFNLAKYPELERLHYVIARVKIGENIYYLDAAYPQLGFGQLAANCYNGHARIISNKDSGSIYFWADSLKERKTTIVIMTNTEKGNMEGGYQSTLGDQESFNTRRKVSETGEKNYFKNIQTSYGEDFSIMNAGIDSLEKPEEPVKIHYDFSLKQERGSPLIYFNPLFGDAWRENPFKAADRKYPVEMYYTIDDTYIFNMEIPAGYQVDELPKSTKVALNGEDGSFEYLIANQDNQIQLRVRLKLNRAYFAPDDYSTLRDFFGFIVKKESEQIVLKQKPG